MDSEEIKIPKELSEIYNNYENEKITREEMIVQIVDLYFQGLIGKMSENFDILGNVHSEVARHIALN